MNKLKRLTTRSPSIDEFDGSDGVNITVLGPVPSKNSGPYLYDWFDDESHTINGHSIVIRIEYGQKSFLLGGDLNIPSEKHLLNKCDFDVWTFSCLGKRYTCRLILSKRYLALGKGE